MDQEEKQIVEEANAIRSRKIGLREKRHAALRAITTATIITVVCAWPLGWGIGILSTLEGRPARVVFIVALAASLLSIIIGVTRALEPVEGKRYVGAVSLAVLVGAIFVVGLTWPF